jgi:uncharacterized GH25 family protein
MQEYNLEKMVQGHEIWLEKSTTKDTQVTLALLYGHNMKQDGVVDKNRFSPSVYLPDGSKGEIELSSVEDRHFLSFKGEKEGYYTVFTDMGTVVYSKNQDGYNVGPKFKFKDVTYSGAFHQMAKTIVPVGNTGSFSAQPTHGILEIIPVKPDCTVGTDAEFTVYYEDKPLVSVPFKAVSKKEGKEIATVETDKDGKALIPITHDGEWMFLARYIDPTKKVSEEFDESVFISTLVLEAR